ncbi:MAG: PD-(D/E)XK nuclease family protein [Sulfurimonas sp.]|uniref:PDDEXK-like family protein n=1 Tax=Sulfurimonas sp. TaxID=2022749 RepID=UPI002629F995|nr:PD-(D/E)XK nuclease family protein [Sulfurimonas sp.]MDD5401641.1 PD-(D/E)XK nuclease family protein [Sulfurimonas sp.]
MTEIEILKKAGLILEQINQDKKVGDDFNIFSVLAMERTEVKHSQILADLLNPNGLHEHGHVFLESFLDKYMRDKIGDFTDFCKKATVSTEQFHIVENQKGYIDIVIETKDIAIVIENKIDAPDQPKQLQRYVSSKINEGKAAFTIYLTLDGKESPSDSRGSLKNEEIIYLSYEEHIVEWIKQCITEALHENVKVVLIQYLSLIEKITNQNSKKENKELTKLLLQNGNMTIAMKIPDALEWAKATIEMEFFKALYENLKDDLKRIGFEMYNGDDGSWTFDDKDIEWIRDIRKYNSKKDSFDGLYFYRKVLFPISDYIYDSA